MISEWGLFPLSLLWEGWQGWGPVLFQAALLAAVYALVYVPFWIVAEVRGYDVNENAVAGTVFGIYFLGPVAVGLWLTYA